MPKERRKSNSDEIVLVFKWNFGGVIEVVDEWHTKEVPFDVTTGLK